MKPVVAIVGGGFTGAAVAYHLAQAGDAFDILVFEPRARLGGGAAYDDCDPAHRINVPASRMSLLPDDEPHFARWLEGSGRLDADPAARVGAEAFPARSAFGAYVAEMLAPLLASGAIRHIRDEVLRLERTDAGWRAATRSGAHFSAEFAVIATTHPPPRLPREIAAFAGHPRLVADSLAPDALARVERGERVLVVGAGLTGADIVASLHAQGRAGEIVMVSRRGLRSRGHPGTPSPAEGDFVTNPSRQASPLLARVRKAVREAQAAGHGWHGVLDAVRLQGQDIWAALDPGARRRLVRHARVFWDVHRFRIAPQIEAVLDAKLADGSLQVRKARLGEVRDAAVGFDVDLGQGFERFQRIVLATGPAHADIFRSQSYLQGLRQDGIVAPDDCGLGLRAGRDGRALGANGVATSRLFIAGPLARGTFGELMGLPAVSAYARFIAETIGRTL